MNKKLNRKGIIKTVSGLVWIAFIACSSPKKEESQNQAEPVIEVVVAKPITDNPTVISLSGQVEASQRATLSTRIMGTINRIYVKLGDKVHKGQLLVSISDQDILAKRGQIEASISASQAELSNAKKDLDRYTILNKENSATDKELENVTLQYKAALSRLNGSIEMRKEINASLGYSRLLAPFSGTVIQKSADEGSLASPGTPILTIEQSGTYQVNASVPENIINEVHLGDKARIDIQSANKTLDGLVNQINTSSEFTGGQYIIKVSLPPNAKDYVKSGMFATVSLVSKNINSSQSKTNTLLVPSSSIVYKDQLEGIYTIGSNNTALLRWVRLGKTYGDKVEVLSGLEKSETFIVSANGKLFDGAPTKIK